MVGMLQRGFHGLIYFRIVLVTDSGLMLSPVPLSWVQVELWTAFSRV